MTALAPGLRHAEWPAAVLGVALAAAILRLPPDGAAAPVVVAAATGALVLWIVWQDLATLTISDAALVAMAAIGIALRWSDAAATGDAPLRAVCGAVVDVTLCGGTLLLFREAFYRLRGIDGLGLGDVKLAGAGALLVGGVGLSWALLAASAAGLAIVAARRGAGRVFPERLAFGAVLAPAIWGAWLVEQALLHRGMS